MSNVKWDLVIPLKKNALEIFEATYFYPLHEDFKTFIKQNNAGIPDKTEFALANGDIKELNSLLSFNKEDDDSVFQYAESFKEGGKLIKLPFARDSFGNLICLDGEKVLFWEHESGRFFKVSGSLKGFLERLENRKLM